MVQSNKLTWIFSERRSRTLLIYCQRLTTTGIALATLADEYLTYVPRFYPVKQNHRLLIRCGSNPNATVGKGDTTTQRNCSSSDIYVRFGYSSYCFLGSRWTDRRPRRFPRFVVMTLITPFFA